MRLKLILRRGWALYGVLLSAMGYAALTLTSLPAYAGTCTAQQCAGANAYCNGVCEFKYQVGGRLIGTCVVGGTGFHCECNNNIMFLVNC